MFLDAQHMIGKQSYLPEEEANVLAKTWMLAMLSIKNICVDGTKISIILILLFDLHKPWYNGSHRGAKGVSYQIILSSFLSDSKGELLKISTPLRMALTYLLPGLKVS